MLLFSQLFKPFNDTRSPLYNTTVESFALYAILYDIRNECLHIMVCRLRSKKKKNMEEKCYSHPNPLKNPLMCMEDIFSFVFIVKALYSWNVSIYEKLHSESHIIRFDEIRIHFYIPNIYQRFSSIRKILWKWHSLTMHIIVKMLFILCVEERCEL